MSSLNKVMLIGNLGKDPEVRYTQGGDAVANITIATSEKWKDKAGEKQEKTEWHRIVLFGRKAEVAGEYLKKGSKAYIEGRLQTKKWTDKEGVERYTTEIICDQLTLLDKRQSDDDGEERPARTKPAAKPAAAKPAASQGDFDDDIPFN